MPITIIDVAKEAGVSKSTVSLVLNNSNLVKMETRYQVLEAIEKLGYVTNINARNLITKKTNILGIIYILEDDKRSYDFDNETGIFGYDVILGIPNVLKGTDYGTLTEHFHYQDSHENIPYFVKTNRVDGVFVVGGLYSESLINHLKEYNIPAVLVNRAYKGVDYVVPDVCDGAYIATKYLVETGHQQICYLNCPPKFASYSDRKVGFCKAIKEYTDKIAWSKITDTSHNTGVGGYAAIARLWESGIRPHGIVAANDAIALGVMRYFYEHNIRIPDEVSIVSYEDSVLAGYTAPALTTININKTLIGEEACRILLNRINRPKSNYISLVLPVTLKIRDSVRDRNP